METSSASNFLILRRAGTALLLFSLAACAAAPKNNPPPQYGPPVVGNTPIGGSVYGPPVPAPLPSYGPEYTPPSPILPLATGPNYGPDAQASRPVVLVLGPGLARGYAYTGVIRALSDAKIKIGAIVGTEMGALIGSLYGLDGSVNKLEWGVQRFRDDVFANDDSVFNKLLNRNPAEKLEESLEHVFGNHEITETKVPMRILIQPAGAGAKVYDHGSLRLLVRAALANTNGFPPVIVDGAPAGTAAALRPFDVQDAKALGIGPVIVVNVMDPKDSDLYPELKEADLILQPEVSGIAKTDFTKRTDAVFAGKAVTKDHMDEIRKLVGGGAP